MLVNDKVVVKIGNRNFSYFLKKYNTISVGDVIEVDIKNLPIHSRQDIEVKCDYCGEKKIIKYKVYYRITEGLEKKYSCKNCKSEKTKETNLIKYGVENVFQLDETKRKSKATFLKKYGEEHALRIDEFKIKSENTFLEKYGVNHPMKSDKIKSKSKKTSLNKYGVDHPSKSEKVKKIYKDNNFKKYGVDHPMKTTILKEKLIKTNNLKYGFNSPILNSDIKNKSLQTLKNNFMVDNPLKSEIIKEKVKNTKIKNLKSKYENIGLNIKNIDYVNMIYTIECDKEKHNFEITTTNLYNRINLKTKICTICNPVNSYGNSGLEINFKSFIEEYYYKKVIFNNKFVIQPHELDIYIPELKLAFEFNGLWWHNELYKENKYHLNKTKECEKQGIQLIHIYEDDWIYKQDVIKSMILNKLGKTPDKIYARKTKLKEIFDNKLIKEFLEKNHIQGFVGSKIKIGLFYNNELVSLMTFGNRRVAMGKKSTNDGEYELSRFCNKLNTNVIGGASKLFKYFIDNYKPEEITTYADRSISQGKLYKTLGFKFQGKTQPNYYYIIDGIRKHRFNFRKDKLIKEGYDSNKTEHEIMLERKIYRIYDSGNLSYKYIK
jgi:hypothetical protein